MSDATVPEYIFSSGLRAQQVRTSRPASRPSSARSTQRSSIESAVSLQIVNQLLCSEPPTPATASIQDDADEDEDEDDEDSRLAIKAVLCHVSSARRAWPERLQFDVPRLIRL
ncbi:hypothetical protein GQ54DRAFT_294750 [Martensiomyces pterosporus]|nr:hypothetical protein GQ54DRAFT_294750 [Martensiomyces pterosporus]